MNTKRLLSLLLIIILILLTNTTTTSTDATTAATATDPYEPNNTLATATPIYLEDYLTATIDPADDVDFYRVDVLAGQVIRAEVYLDGFYLQDSASPLLLQLAVLDGTGAVLAESDMCSNTGNVAEVEATLTNTAAYYIRVRPCPGTSDPQVAYNLSIEPKDHIKIKPNNTITNAQDFGGRIQGAIDPITNIDFFKFSNTHNKTIHFNAQNNDFPTTFKPSLTVFDSAGTLLAEVSSSNEYANLKVILPTNNTYYLHMQNANGPETYRINNNPKQIDDIEPNDTPAQTELIGYNTRSKSMFEGTEDMDYYKFNDQTNNRIQFNNMNEYNINDFDENLITLLDANQNIVAQTK